MIDNTNTTNQDTNEAGPVVQEKVERDSAVSTVAPRAVTKEPAAKKKAKKKAPVAAASTKEPATPTETPAAPRAPKKKAKKKTAKKTPPAQTVAKPKKNKGRPKGSKNSVKKSDKKDKKKVQWRKGRQWPVLPCVLYINVQTRKPKALAVAIRKVLWKYTLRGPRKGKKTK